MRLALLLALSVLAQGCLSGDGPAAEDAPRADFEFEGTISGTLDLPGKKELAFDVPAGVDAVEAVLSFDGASDLYLVVVDPAGAQMRGTREAEGEERVLGVPAPVAGQWTARVGAIDAEDAPFTLRVELHETPPMDARESGRTRLAPRDFLELNLLVNAGASLEWAFESTDGVAWDLHSHPEGEVVTHASGKDATAESGTFTAPTRGVYSLFVLNDGALDVEVSWSAEGAFRVQSVTR